MWHQIARQPGTKLRHQTTAPFLRNIKVGSASHLIQLVKVVGQDALLEQTFTQLAKCVDIIINTLQEYLSLIHI